MADLSTPKSPSPKMGRPRVDATPITVRVHPPQLAALDAWISEQSEPNMSRPEAARRLIDAGLRLAQVADRT